LTVAVWVGYPTGGRAMETEYRGEPVAGGTYPAEIWRDFMLGVKKIREARAAQHKAGSEDELLSPTSTVPAPVVETPAEGKKGGKEKSAKSKQQPSRKEKTPANQPETPADQQQTPAEPAPSSGGSGGVGGDSPVPQNP
jgi:penicillin-binding protein 1A